MGIMGLSLLSSIIGPAVPLGHPSVMTIESLDPPQTHFLLIA
jgi:hypothetical protein